MVFYHIILKINFYVRNSILVCLFLTTEHLHIHQTILFIYNIIIYEKYKFILAKKQRLSENIESRRSFRNLVFSGHLAKIVPRGNDYDHNVVRLFSLLTICLRYFSLIRKLIILFIFIISSFLQ